MEIGEAGGRVAEGSAHDALRAPLGARAVTLAVGRSL
jgi:hypothetical protein